MTIETTLRVRSESKCELCSATGDLVAHSVPPAATEDADRSVLLCATCRDQVAGAAQLDVHHWRCLADSMWSEVPAVQVMAWRMLTKLNTEAWARDLLETLYLDEESLAWAQAATEEETSESTGPHLDSNGVLLEAGDTVTLTKDLVVKGAGFTAKRGTPVRGITLVADNPEHIEGRVSGQRIVILTKFVKKS